MNRLPRWRVRVSERFASVAIALSVSCGGASGPTVSSPMTPRDTEVFDSSVDYVERPADLGGSWATSAATELEDRVKAADLVAIGSVRTIRSDSDPSGHRTLRVVLELEEVLLGEATGEISLPVTQAEPGFDSVEGHDRQLLRRRYLMFVKWAYGPARSVVARWHLSPASEANLTDVRRTVRARRAETSGN